MAKRDVHLKLAVGNKFLTVEEGSGYAADSQAAPMLDAVNVSIRSKTASGGVGAIDERSLYVKREQILALGLNFLALASQMTPRTMWARSETVGCGHQEPTIIPLLEKDLAALAEWPAEGVKKKYSDTCAQYDNLRRRMHTLQRCQRLLESLPDAEAHQLDMLLACLEGTGSLPFGVQMVAIPPEELAAMLAAKETKH